MATSLERFRSGASCRTIDHRHLPTMQATVTAFFNPANCREYNFDGDERWTSYLRTVEFPSGANDGLLQRAKARWYKREVDPEVDIALLIPNSGGPPPPPQPAAAPPPPRPAPPPTATPPPAPAPRTSQAVTLPDTALFLGHLLLIVCAALTLQPLSPLLRYQGFYFACRASVFVHGFRVSWG